MGQRLRFARRLRRMTQTDLAKQAEVEQPLVSKIEVGRIDQTAAIARLAEALRVSPRWLERGAALGMALIQAGQAKPVGQQSLNCRTQNFGTYSRTVCD